MIPSSRPRRILFIVLFWASTVLTAAAQGVGGIGGTIVDSSGAVLPGAAVTLSNPGTIGGNQETLTDGRGAPVSQARARHLGESRARRLPHQRPRQHRRQRGRDGARRLKLDIGTLEEGLIVKGESPLLDTTTR
jgi:hypothetical protein